MLSWCSRASFGGESGCSVVDDDMESSGSETFDGVGEVPRIDDELVVVRC